MPAKIVFTSHIPEVLKGMEDTAEKRMAESVQAVKGEIDKVLSGNRSGRQYKIPGSNSYYTASSPGQPPASRLGELRQSIKAYTQRVGSTIIGVLGTDFLYGLWLQVGTKGGKTITPKSGKFLMFDVDGETVFAKQVTQGPIAPRPWLDVAFRNAWDKVVSIWSRSWEK